MLKYSIGYKKWKISCRILGLARFTISAISSNIVHAMENTQVTNHISQPMINFIISYLIGKYLTRVLRRINHAAREKSDNGSIELDGTFRKVILPAFPCCRDRLLNTSLLPWNDKWREPCKHTDLNYTHHTLLLLHSLFGINAVSNFISRISYMGWWQNVCK